MGPAQKLSEGKKLAWSITLYLATVAGVLAEAYFGTLTQPKHGVIGWSVVAFAALVAAVILPAVYHSAQLDRKTPSFVSFLLCIQHGYFWKSIVSHLASLQH